MSVGTLSPEAFTPLPQLPEVDLVPAIVFDLDHTGIPDGGKREGMIPFGADLMVRAVIGNTLISPTAGRTSYTKITNAATSTVTAPPAKGGSPDQRGDTKSDLDVFTDQT